MYVVLSLLFIFIFIVRFLRFLHEQQQQQQRKQRATSTTKVATLNLHIFAQQQQQQQKSPVVLVCMLAVTLTIFLAIVLHTHTQTYACSHTQLVQHVVCVILHCQRKLQTRKIFICFCVFRFILLSYVFSPVSPVSLILLKMALKRSTDFQLLFDARFCLQTIRVSKKN